MNILVCFGTRPEWLKVKPLVDILDNCKLFFTGQHEDLLKDVKVDYKVEIQENTNRLDQVVSDCLLQFPNEDFDVILVQGDTASAFACALAAFHRHKKIYYLEAGLRSYDLQHPYPEEGYRQMISRLSDVNLCPTSISKKNLKAEEVKGKCYVVGNTVLDNLVSYKYKTQYTNTILVTLHRRENLPVMHEWFTQVDLLAKENSNFEFILPLHPNPEVQKHKHLLKHVNVVDPLPHSKLLDVLAKCKMVISDSGGIQEESSFFNKKVIVCRKTTERPEGIISGHLFICKLPQELCGIFNDLKDNYQIEEECPYGDGLSSFKIAKLFNEGL